MWLLDRIEKEEKEDKEYYDKIFNEFKTAFLKKFRYDWTDEQIRWHLENILRMKMENFKEKFENQKIIADEISVSLSKKELELLIYKLSDMPIINKQALYIFQKLTEKLETLEQNNERN